MFSIITRRFIRQWQPEGYESLSLSSYDSLSVISVMRPSFMEILQSAREASCSSCVTITKVCPILSRRSKKRRCSSCLFCVSSDPLGSSAKTTSGLQTRALATATLCFSPPESSLGLCEERSLSPMKPSSSYARCRAVRLGPTRMRAGIITLSKAVNSGNN